MPKLETSVTTVAEVEISPRLKKKLSLILARYQQRAQEIDTLSALQNEAKEEIETAFIDAGEYEALQNGVRVDDIPLKRIDGQKTKSTDYASIMKKFKITPKAWAAFVSVKDKKGYLHISLPK